MPRMCSRPSHTSAKNASGASAMLSTSKRASKSTSSPMDTTISEPTTSLPMAELKPHPSSACSRRHSRLPSRSTPNTRTRWHTISSFSPPPNRSRNLWHRRSGESGAQLSTRNLAPSSTRACMRCARSRLVSRPFRPSSSCASNSNLMALSRNTRYAALLLVFFSALACTTIPTNVTLP